MRLVLVFVALLLSLPSIVLTSTQLPLPILSHVAASLIAQLEYSPIVAECLVTDPGDPVEQFLNDLA